MAVGDKMLLEEVTELEEKWRQPVGFVNPGEKWTCIQAGGGVGGVGRGQVQTYMWIGVTVSPAVHIKDARV